MSPTAWHADALLDAVAGMTGDIDRLRAQLVEAHTLLADERRHADRLAASLADPADDDAARAHRALLVALHARRRAGGT